jgi:methylamine dehydrogenase heavy chain
MGPPPCRTPCAACRHPAAPDGAGEGARGLRALAALLLGLAAAAAPAGSGAGAEAFPEPTGRVLALPAAPGPHWIWLGDQLLHRAALFDGDSGRLLGMIPGGRGIIAPQRSHDGREIYTAETYYSRGTRGARTDLVSITDATTLQPLGEVEIPPKRSEHTSWVGGSALSDDGRLFAVFNLDPATSLSIVDVAERRLLGEVEIPGCALVYPAGPRRFLSLCADGTALTTSVGTDGGFVRTRSDRFFDPAADPVTEKAVRSGDTWLFVSFAGVVHPVDVAGPSLRFGETWPLLDDADREASWRPGGMQPFALHAPSGHLYALMHQGGTDTHKDPGVEVWVYDVATHARMQRIRLRNPVASFLLGQLSIPSDGWIDWLLQHAMPSHGVDRIAVTEDPEPLLFAATTFPATLTVYDARSGAHLRDVRDAAIAGALLQVP